MAVRDFKPGERAQRALENERELNIALTSRVYKPSSHAERHDARGVPAVNALQTRVTLAYAGARAGSSKWSNVSVMDAHKPASLLRNMRPKAETPCVCTRADGSTYVLEAPRKQRKSTQRRSNVAAELAREQREAKLALLRSVSVTTNVD